VRSSAAASIATRWGIFHTGIASADDPKYTAVPQRERLRGHVAEAGPTTALSPTTPVQERAMTRL